MGTVYFELNSEKQNENFIQEIQEILIERYELEKGSSEWDEIVFKLKFIQDTDPDYFFYESPSYWASLFVE